MLVPYFRPYFEGISPEISGLYTVGTSNQSAPEMAVDDMRIQPAKMVYGYLSWG